MNQLAPDRDMIKILPGEFAVVDDETPISTVLGSCVSACLRDPLTGIGGMNHFMLPSSGDSNEPLPISHRARYGVQAMELLINALLKAGAERRRLEAKVFGGGKVLDAIRTIDIGGRNAAFVVDFLATERIPIIARDMLGSYPRRIVYLVSTGEVWVKPLIRLRNDTIARRETEYARRLHAPRAIDVELFRE